MRCHYSRVALLLFSASLLLSIASCGSQNPSPVPPDPCPPQPPPYSKSNPECPGTSALVGYCCGCSSADDHFAHVMRALNISDIIKRRISDCISRTNGENEAKDCISVEHALDEELKIALIRALEHASGPDSNWEGCQRRALSEGTCRLKEEWDTSEKERVSECRKKISNDNNNNYPVQLYCCNAYGIRICPMIIPALPGSMCGCAGAYGMGIVCR